MSGAMARSGAVAVALAVSALVGCGGGGGGSSSTGGGGAQTCMPGSTAAFTITSAGISPVNVCVVPGGQVTFTNNDTASHDFVFETGGASCPTIGAIAPAGHVTATFTTSATCTFHDASNASNTAFRGTVAVTSVQVSGGGY